MTKILSPALSFIVAWAYVMTGWLDTEPNEFWGSPWKGGGIARAQMEGDMFPWIHLFGSIVLIWFKDQLADVFYTGGDGGVYGRRTEIVGWVFLLLPFIVDMAML